MFKKNKNIYIILFVIMLGLSLFRIIFNFSFFKESYHSDEIWSFGLSNSYYEPFIYQSADHTEKINIDTWFSSEVLRDYLTVKKEQRFSYGSVIYNQNNDYHPPLYYLILHTICSFFAEKFSFWYAFFINIFAYIIASVFFFRLIYEITKSETAALYGYMFYAFSMGILNTFVFVRMYALLSMFAVLSMYFHARLYYTGNIRYILPVSVITLLGALTHHFYLPFAAGVSLCFCVYYLIKRKCKIMFTYGLSILGTVILSVLIFPATIKHLFSGRIDDPKFTPSWQIIMTFNCMFNELFGFNVPVIPKFSYSAILIIIICSLIIISPLFILIRKNKKNIGFTRSFKNIIMSLSEKIKCFDLIVVSSFISSLVVILTTAATVSLMFMGELTDRYIFIIYPCVCVAFVCLVFWIIKRIVYKQLIRDIISITVCLCMIISSNINSRCYYLFEKPDDSVSIKELAIDANCVVFNKEHWFLTCFTYELMNSGYVYAATGENLEEEIRNLPDAPDKDKPMYFIINSLLFKAEDEQDSLIIEGAMPSLGESKDKSNMISKNEFECLIKGIYSDYEYIGHDFVFQTEYYIYSVS